MKLRSPAAICHNDLARAKRCHSLAQYLSLAQRSAILTLSQNNEAQHSKRLNLLKSSIVAIATTLTLPPGCSVNPTPSCSTASRETPVPIALSATADQTMGIASDQILHRSPGDNPSILRRIGCWDQETGKCFEFPTHQILLSARTIADIDKDRWQVKSSFSSSRKA